MEKDSILSHLALHGPEPYQNIPQGEELIVSESGSGLRKDVELNRRAINMPVLPGSSRAGSGSGRSVAWYARLLGVQEVVSSNLKNILIVQKDEEERVIPLSHELREHLQNYLDSHSFEEAIFISPSGERLTERAVQYILKKFNMNPQKLRHTFCQRLIDNQIDLETVSRLAGHKDINVTKRYIKSQMDKQKLEEDINNAFTDETVR